MAEPHNLRYNYGRPDMRLPYRWNDDTPISLPLGPKNVHVTSPFLIGVIDIRWDAPSLYAENNGLNVTGVNIYKAYDSPKDKVLQLNSNPVGVLYYRDQTAENFVDQEDPMAGGRIIMGTNATGDWVATTFYKPIVIPDSNGDIAYNYTHVKVDIKETASDPFVTVPAWKVVGETGEVFLIRNPVYNHTTNQIDAPILPDPNKGGEVRISYTYINNHIQTDINRKIYYKVTTVAVDPESGDTIETPLDQVEAISLYDMEKIDWVWSEAIRRNRWILEQGGERVRVFIRKWAGEKCPCIDDDYRTGRADCHVCFHPDMPVRTKTGWRPISTISVGDYVLTADGSYQKVRRLFKNPFEGDLVSIQSSVSTEPILSTPNHPFLVLRSGHRKSGCGPKCDTVVRNGDGLRLDKLDVRKLPSGRWHARVAGKKGRIALGTYVTKKEACNAVIKYRVDNFTPMHRLEWDSASNISEKDWLVPRWNYFIKDIDTVSIPNKFCAKNKFGPIVKGKKEFPVNTEFLWILGLYLAEGNASKRSISFSLNKKERLYADRVISFFEKMGYNAKIHESKISDGMVVNVYGVYLSRWFPEWVGSKCYTKKIPEEFMNLPSDKTWALIEGLYAGDNGEENQITQTSEVLAMQLVELLHRVGEQPLVRRQVASTVTPKGNKRRTAYCVGWAVDSFSNRNRKNRWMFKGEVLSKVRSVDDYKYKGFVYNLEVAGNHTYVVNNIAVHNCFGTGYVGGYEGPYDIIVAPPETEKTVELMDTGLHVNYDWATWTGPYPLLNDRDIVIRQNNNRFTIGHVNPQGSRGAIYQQHFMLAPLDHHDIRYQIPINGGALVIPESWNAYRESRPTDASPTIPVKPEIPDQYEYTGRTVTFENIVYTLPFLLMLTMDALINILNSGINLWNSVL